MAKSGRPDYSRSTRRIAPALGPVTDPLESRAGDDLKGRTNMQIHGPSHVQGVHAKEPTRPQKPAPSAAPTSNAPVDELDISPEAELLAQAKDLPEIRADKVADIRAQIESGTYETDEKLDLALERLLDEIA